MNTNRRCVFTTLIGDYEALNEQEVSRKSALDFICFTDNQNLKSDTWKIIPIDPVLPYDSVRSAKAIKICAHQYLPNYDTSLYIDNSVTLNVKPEDIFTDLHSEAFDMICFEHSFRKNLMEEFALVLKHEYDKPNIIIEQLNAYSLIDSRLVFQKPYWAGFMIRSHNAPSIIKAMEDWMVQIMRYSRRDQLSLNYILQKHSLNFKGLEIDNRHSQYHDWPTSTRYGDVSLKQSLFTNIESNLRVIAQEKEINRLKQLVWEQNRKIDLLQEQIKFYSESKSWLITKPLRATFNLFRKNKPENHDEK